MRPGFHIVKVDALGAALLLTQLLHHFVQCRATDAHRFGDCIPLAVVLDRRQPCQAGQTISIRNFGVIGIVISSQIADCHFFRQRIKKRLPAMNGFKFRHDVPLLFAA
jgi:hypothetical protein